jgi:methylisocitrate lyase
MKNSESPGARLRDAVEEENPLQIVGTVNAMCALLAQRAGFRAIYLSGAGVANASYGLPDLALTTLNDVLEDVRRITRVTRLPLLVDADTGWGNALMVARTTQELINAGAAGMHLEDQVEAKRCGHRPGKALVSAEKMEHRVRAAVDGRTDPAFVVMARTDAVASEGIDSAIARCRGYLDAGADMIFAEALGSVEDYRRFTEALDAPVLANITEFGRTPLYTLEDLRTAGIGLALYPLSAFRGMNRAAEEIYRDIRSKGTQAGKVSRMQTRAELYELLDYHTFESQLDTIREKEEEI